MSNVTGPSRPMSTRQTALSCSALLDTPNGVCPWCGAQIFHPSTADVHEGRYLHIQCIDAIATLDAAYEDSQDKRAERLALTLRENWPTIADPEQAARHAVASGAW